MFSIIIPTFNNLNYLKLCINSIKKNSRYNHEIIIHINEGTDGTLDYVKKNDLKYTYSKENSGLCTGTNLAASKASTSYILYSHDDMYFCPNWDTILEKEIKNQKSNAYYISGTMIEKNGGHIKLDFGNTFEDFNEDKLINEYKNIRFINHQGTHWAPHLIHKEYWDRVGGFSEEFNPGIGSDPDLNMKLWKSGVRIFKGLGDFKVYHFGSLVLRKKKNFTRNKGAKTFLRKWGITPSFFVKYYLNGGEFINGKILCKEFDGPLSEPNSKSINYWFDLIKCKISYLYLSITK